MRWQACWRVGEIRVGDATGGELNCVLLVVNSVGEEHENVSCEVAVGLVRWETTAELVLR